MSLGVAAGGGTSVASGLRQGTVASVLTRIGYVFAEQGHLLPGSLEVVGEPGYLHVWERHDQAELAAFSALLKYNFRTPTRFTPFVEGGAGVSYATARIPPTGTLFNFITQAGAGVQYAVTPAVTIDARGAFHHLSNANTGKQNPSLNTMLFSLGVSWHF